MSELVACPTNTVRTGQIHPANRILSFVNNSYIDLTLYYTEAVYREAKGEAVQIDPITYVTLNAQQ